MQSEHSNAARGGGIVTALRDILVPVDFSEQGIVASTYARQIARLTASQITLLHVNPSAGGDSARSAFDHRDWPKNPEAAAAVARRIDSILDGLHVQRVVLAGDPAERIIEHARATGVDLILMPTRGLGPVRRFLLGSVTAKVLHDVDCPVWSFVQDVATETLPAEPQLRRVACAVDLGPESAGIIRWAGALAEAFRASLTILHASPHLEPVIGVVHEPEWGAQLGNILRGEVEKLRMEAGVEADIRLAGGEPAKTITAMTAELQADVLVIGRPVANHFLGRLRTHSYAIIRQSRCPVVSV